MLKIGDECKSVYHHQIWGDYTIREKIFIIMLTKCSLNAFINNSNFDYKNGVRSENGGPLYTVYSFRLNNGTPLYNIIILYCLQYNTLTVSSLVFCCIRRNRYEKTEKRPILHGVCLQRYTWTRFSIDMIL